MTFIKHYGADMPAAFFSVLLFVASMVTSTTSVAAPSLSTPSANTTLSGTSQTLQWSAGGVDVDKWWLYVGTSGGASDIANSGDLGTNTQYQISGVPVDGRAIHVRLWYFSSAAWRYIDSRHTAASLANVSAPAMVNPVNGNTVLGGSADFNWQDNNTPVNYWWLFIGSKPGKNDFYDSGPSLRTQNEVTVNQLPEDGSTLHARLWYRTTGLEGWRSQDSTFNTPDGRPVQPAGDANPVAENIAMIYANSTRNTVYDNNPFRDVPASDISLSDLTEQGDTYNQPLQDASTSGFFRTKCEMSHFAYDDPIVYPNQPGRAHLHMFFGNTEANAYSSFDSLLNNGTSSCNGEDLNRTAYWVPAMLDSQGDALIPEQIMVYYKNINFRLNGANELNSPFPDNLRMVSGKGASTSPQTASTSYRNVQPIVSFTCGPPFTDTSRERRQALIPDCYGNTNWLEMQVVFPNCVREDAGQYRADQSHTSFPIEGYFGAECPASHPIDVPSIVYRIFYDPQNYGGSLTNLRLSSDVKMDRILPGGTTSHGDWFGAWHPDAMDMWVENCNNKQVDCETGLLRRSPAVSLVHRKRDVYPRGYKAPGSELVKLCPGKTFNSQDPLRSVAMCRMR